MEEKREFSILLTPYNLKIISLPLYKDAYLLLQLSISTFIQSNKLLLATLCKRAIELEIDIIVLIEEAYRNLDKKLKCLNTIQSRHLRLYTILKLIIDNSKICQENASRFTVLLELIGKQTNAWIRESGFQ